MTRVVLASASPRRRELLAPVVAASGLDLVVRPADVDESVLPGEGPETYVRRVSAWKCAAIAGDPGDVVVAADTTVDVDGQILAKPADAADAARMLRLLAGRTHQVHTGVSVRRGGRDASLVVCTSVTFAPMTEGQIVWYVATGEPFDKAGAYAIQGIGGAFVQGVEGSVSNVVGLPLAQLIGLVRGVGVDLIAPVS
jgi:septum formation protein